MRASVRAFVRHQVAPDLADHIDIFDTALVTSLFAMQLVTFVEQTFHLVVESDDLDLDNFRSIDRLTAFVTSKAVPTERQGA